MNELQLYSQQIIEGVVQIIETARKRVAIYVNQETTLLYYEIGRYVNLQILQDDRASYGLKIVATLSQQLTLKFGKGYTYSAVTRMMKVAKAFNEENIATLSQQLSWSHFVELVGVDDSLKQEFYCTMCMHEKWGVRELREKIDSMLFERTAIAANPKLTIKNELQKLSVANVMNPDLVFKNTYVLDFLQLPHYYSEKELENALISHLEQFILELGTGFAFVERQKRISVDAIDYHLDLLFYHRKLRRLIAIDLKLGKFKHSYKSQMELYLSWLEKYEMQPGEEKPIGLLLCSEGNTEHIELLMLDNDKIKVAQYLTELPTKEWFADKLHRAIEIAKMNTEIQNK